MKNNRLIALFAGLSLALVSSVALAAPSADTLLVAGYDTEEMAVLYGVSGIDQDGDEVTLDCTVETGDYTYALDPEADEQDTEVAVAELKDKDGEVEFSNEDESGDPISYTDLFNSTEDDGKDCLLTSVKIEANGDGEVNHGTVVSTFANLLDGGKGCIIRHFAQSDFGKESYEDAEGNFEVTLQSIMTSCEKGKDRVSGDEESPSNGKAKGLDKDRDKGRPAHAGPPAHAKGKKSDS